MNDFGGSSKIFRVACVILFRFKDYQVDFLCCSGEGLLLWLVVRIPTSLSSDQEQWQGSHGSVSVKWYGVEVGGLV